MNIHLNIFQRLRLKLNNINYPFTFEKPISTPNNPNSIHKPQTMAHLMRLCTRSNANFLQAY